MILVDICVPAIDKVYDFVVDEYARVAEVTASLADLICQKEQCRMTGDVSRLTLWRLDNGQRLEPGQTLDGCEIGAGMTLILV